MSRGAARSVVACAVSADGSSCVGDNAHYNIRAQRPGSLSLCAETAHATTLAVQRVRKRKPPRLERIYEFGNPPLFLVTFNTHGRCNLLSRDQVHAAFVEYCARASGHGTGVGRYVLMPDHVHLFVSFGAGTTITLSTWIKGVKRQLDRCLLSLGSKPLAMPGQKLCSFRQPGFHDRLLRHDESYAQKWDYVRTGLVSNADDWPYAGEIVAIDRV